MNILCKIWDVATTVAAFYNPHEKLTDINWCLTDMFKI